MTRSLRCSLGVMLLFTFGCTSSSSVVGAGVLSDAIIGPSDFRSTAILVDPSQCLSCNGGLTDALARIRGGDRTLVLVAAWRPSEQEALRLTVERLHLRNLSQALPSGLHRELPLAVWRAESSTAIMAPLRSSQAVRRLAGIR